MPVPHSLLGRPFADAALELAERGLAVIPCPGDDGKSPLGAVSGFHRWQKPPGERFIRKLIDKHGDANIGIVTSLSGVTVADVDGDDSDVQAVIRRAGDTPLMTRTPSGGCHLWYRGNGERNTNLRLIGLPVDVKAAAAGVIIVPPSRRRTTGVAYDFEKGGWDDLHQLPVARPGSLSVRAEGQFETLHQVGPGNRNNALFRLALREARHCDDLTSLIDVISGFNGQLLISLDESEVTKIAKSAWGYQVRGENWVGHEARAIIQASEIDLVARARNGGDALLVYVRLRTANGARDARGEPFAISPRLMADARTFGRMSADRIRAARKTLLSAGLLRRVHEGGRGPHDPALFRFTR
jgi:hypothetical protein